MANKPRIGQSPVFDCGWVMRAGSQKPDRGVEGLMEENAKCMKRRFNGQGKASTCGGLTHPSGCTLSFPSLGPRIGAHHCSLSWL